MLWNWFGFGKQRGPADRLLFPYRDGVSKRRADPVYIEKILAEKLGDDWPGFIAGLSNPLPLGIIGEAADLARAERRANQERAAAAICAAFDVKPFRHGRENDAGQTGAGLGEIELFGLLSGYQRWAAMLLEYARPFANGQPRASPTPAAPPAPSSPESTLASAESPAPAPPTSPTQ